MSLDQEINKLEQEARAAIKEAEAATRDIREAVSGATQTVEAFRRGIGNALDPLVAAFRAVKEFEEDFDHEINSMKFLRKDIPEIKKKNAECERFYNQLLEEKEEKDAARKQAGRDYKPTREDLLFDAVFKKTSAAHDQSKQLSDRVDSLRKEIDEGTKLGIEGAKQLAAASVQAVGAFERQVAALQGIGPLRFLEPKDAEKRPDIKEDVVERLKGLNMLRPLYS
jgi:DNA repair ATPase RecN